ncbi:hypothetical protein B0T24DRAFT_599889 [Lasiosphaeria ovina]|uniref:Uncharacterized protein n=1 Tax=Lasiosphaeria ovina TaxID=92902 RepID=A0AAE0MZ04_9PEZI|nr:hypothetical protein B0T24DRAFT_599889 [Lasiosphaeria ovina]
MTPEEIAAVKKAIKDRRDIVVAALIEARPEMADPPVAEAAIKDAERTVCAQHYTIGFGKIELSTNYINWAMDHVIWVRFIRGRDFPDRQPDRFCPPYNLAWSKFRKEQAEKEAASKASAVPPPPPPPPADAAQAKGGASARNGSKGKGKGKRHGPSQQRETKRVRVEESARDLSADIGENIDGSLRSQLDAALKPLIDTKGKQARHALADMLEEIIEDLRANPGSATCALASSDPALGQRGHTPRSTSGRSTGTFGRIVVNLDAFRHLDVADSPLAPDMIMQVLVDTYKRAGPRENFHRFIESGPRGVDYCLMAIWTDGHESESVANGACCCMYQRSPWDDCIAVKLLPGEEGRATLSFSFGAELEELDEL